MRIEIPMDRRERLNVLILKELEPFSEHTIFSDEDCIAKIATYTAILHCMFTSNPETPNELLDRLAEIDSMVPHILDYIQSLGGSSRRIKQT